MKNKKLTWVLVALVAGIWGTIAYQLYTSMAEDDRDNSPSVSPMQLSSNPVPFVYASDVRDPFRYVVARRDTTKKVSPTTPTKVWTPPALKLSGILLTGKRRTAMLEGTDGAVFFVHEGDTLRGVKLLKISDQTVGYVYQSKKDEWTIPRQ
jgi:Tfp pilus assembly protein PilP